MVGRRKAVSMQLLPQLLQQPGGALALLVVLDLAALRWAVDSRDNAAQIDNRWRWRGNRDE